MEYPKTQRAAIRKARTCIIEAYTGMNVFYVKIAKKEMLRLYNLAPYTWTVTYEPEESRVSMGPKDETIPDDCVLISKDGKLFVSEAGVIHPYSEITTSNKDHAEMVAERME